MSGSGMFRKLGIKVLIGRGERFPASTSGLLANQGVGGAGLVASLLIGVFLAAGWSDPSMAQNRYIVGVRPAATPAGSGDGTAAVVAPTQGPSAQDELRGVGAVVVSSVSTGGAVVVTADASQVSTIQGLSSVAYVEPDHALSLFLTPNDSAWTDAGSWGLKAAPGIRGPEAWDLWRGSSGAVIAVLDTGIDLSHPDLAGKIWRNTREIGGNGVDDDGNGYIDDVNGWDFANGDNSPQDDHGHGTQVAGIAAATTNNGTGIAGVCWNCAILPLKIFDASGYGTLSASLQAMDYVVRLRQSGVNVVVMNISFGGAERSQAERDALAAAGTAGISVVAAAGNDASSNDTQPIYPASFSTELANVLSVGAVASDGSFASFSNFGNSVDIAAPGLNIISSYPVGFGGSLGNYELLSGTSASVPFVAGIIGLLQSYQPRTAAQVKGLVLQTALVRASLSGKVRTGGHADAYGALMAARGSSFTYPVRGSIRANQTPVAGVNVVIYADGTPSSAVTNTLGEFVSTPLPEGAIARVVPTSGVYTFVPAELTAVVAETPSSLLFSAVVAATQTPVVTPLPTNTAAPSATPLPTVIQTNTPSATPTRTATATATGTATRTSTATSTPLPTSTATRTSTATSTPLPTATRVATSTATPTRTPTRAATATVTPTPSRTASPRATFTPTAVVTDTPMASPTPDLEEPTATSTPEATSTATATSSPEDTVTPDDTPTTEPTSTPTVDEPTVVSTPVATATATPRRTPERRRPRSAQRSELRVVNDCTRTDRAGIIVSVTAADPEINSTDRKFRVRAGRKLRLSLDDGDYQLSFKTSASKVRIPAGMAVTLKDDVVVSLEGSSSRCRLSMQ